MSQFGTGPVDSLLTLKSMGKVVATHQESTLAFDVLAAGKFKVVFAVSDYDGRIHGYKVAVEGCLACTQPVSVGAAGEKRFVTTRTPSRDADSLPNAVEVSHTNLTFESMKDALCRGENIEIRGLGAFHVKNYEGYQGRNPKTGQVIPVKPKRGLLFRTGKELRDRVNRTAGGPDGGGGSGDDESDAA